MSNAAAVSVTGLIKRYGSTEALRGVTFEVGRGQIYGLLGPNGAGKTTTLECILGLRQSDGGSIQVDGVDLRTDPTRARQVVGAQLQSAALQDKITPRQALDLFGSFYTQRFSTTELLDRFDLAAKADVHFSKLSGGQRQRLFLALAIVNRPALLVLDEPTAGLDPQARRELRALILDMKAEGRTVLLSTHDMDEAGQLCDWIAIIDAGLIVAAAPPAELMARAQAPARVIIRTAPPLPAAAVRDLPGVIATASAGDRWTLDTSSPTRLLADVSHRADQAGAELLDVELRRPTLEDVFLELTGHPWSAEDQPGGLS